MIYIEKIKLEIVNKLKPLKPNKIILFGSYDYGEPNENSDMGLLPYGKPTIDDAKKFYNFAKEVFHKVVNILNIKNDEYIINIYKNHKFLNEF